ncbi:hypothetical protein GIB67_025281, partial [Kingdonia uniflora]
IKRDLHYHQKSSSHNKNSLLPHRIRKSSRPHLYYSSNKHFQKPKATPFLHSQKSSLVVELVYSSQHLHHQVKRFLYLISIQHFVQNIHYLRHCIVILARTRT